MKITRNLWAAVGLAALAFAAGRMNLRTSADVYAADQEPPEMDAETLAYIAAGTPGEHHTYLEAMVGEWEGVFRLWMEPGKPPIESVGTVKREWVLGGRYVREVVEATTEGWGEFHGLGYIGYNNIDGQYQIIWMDSMSTAITSWTGSYNPETKTFTSHGAYRDPTTGKVYASRSVMDMSNPDRHVSSDYTTGPDGIERKTMEGVAERIMKKKK